MLEIKDTDNKGIVQISEDIFSYVLNSMIKTCGNHNMIWPKQIIEGASRITATIISKIDIGDI